jgi:hypothetical protein
VDGARSADRTNELFITPYSTPFAHRPWGPPSPPIQCVPTVLCSGDKRPSPETAQSPLSKLRINGALPSGPYIPSRRVQGQLYLSSHTENTTNFHYRKKSVNGEQGKQSLFTETGTQYTV